MPIESLSSPCRRFPAGSNGEFNIPEDLAAALSRGEGCHVWDVMGRRYVDFSMGWGSVLPGHAHPAVVEAVQRQAPLGTNFACVNEQSLMLADVIAEAFPGMAQLRFCASGTEATQYCIRLARAHTGRHKILKFEGAYHGAGDAGVVSLFPMTYPAYPQSEATSRGLPPGTEAETLVAPFNDADATTAIVQKHGAELAAIIVEPLHRCFPPEDGFLHTLRDLADQSGAVLIFDEVVTGFRLAYGGAQEKYGVSADLTALGKALGGGLPIGAFGGKPEILELVREDRLGVAPYVWTASTLGGNPVSCAAALAALVLYRQPGCYERLYELGAVFRSMLADAFQQAGLRATILGDGPLAQFALMDHAATGTRDLRDSNRVHARAIMLGLLQEGIWLNPMGTKLYLSLAHDEAALQEFIAALKRVLREKG